MANKTGQLSFEASLDKASVDGMILPVSIVPNRNPRSLESTKFVRRMKFIEKQIQLNEELNEEDANWFGAFSSKNFLQGTLQQPMEIENN